MEIIVLSYTYTDVDGDILYRFKTHMQILIVKTLQDSFCKLYEVSSLRAWYLLSTESTT